MYDANLRRVSGTASIDVSSYEPLTSTLLHYVKDELEYRHGWIVNTSSWTVHVHEVAQEEPTSGDCGIFALSWIAAIAQGRENMFTQGDALAMRLRIAHSIMLSGPTGAGLRGCDGRL